MQAIDEVLRRNEGAQRVQITLTIGGEQHVFASRSRRVEWGTELTTELEAVIGQFGQVELVEPESEKSLEEGTGQEESLLAVA